MKRIRNGMIPEGGEEYSYCMPGEIRKVSSSHILGHEICPLVSLGKPTVEVVSGTV